MLFFKGLKFFLFFFLFWIDQSSSKLWLFVKDDFNFILKKNKIGFNPFKITKLKEKQEYKKNMLNKNEKENEKFFLNCEKI